MQFRTNQSTFDEILSLTNRAIPSKATHPVLSCFLIEADATQDAVSVTGFDLGMGINATFSAIVEKGGTCAVPAKLLLDIVSRLPEGEIVFKVSDLLLTLTNSSGNYAVRTMEPDEYPELPDISENPLWQIEFNPEGLAAGIRNTAFAASTDEAKQVLSGIHLKVSGGYLELAATDGHRLSLTSVMSGDASDGEGTEFKATIPLRAMREVERLLQRCSDPIVLNFSEDQVLLRTKGDGKTATIVARTLQGAYPNYPDLIPPVFTQKILVDRKRLLASVERINVFALGKSPACLFAISEEDQCISLSSQTQDIGNGRESIAAQVTGTDITFGFNIKYLLDILKAGNSPEIELHANSAFAPVVFKPLGGANVTFLMMPVQLRGGNNESTRVN